MRRPGVGPGRRLGGFRGNSGGGATLFTPAALGTVPVFGSSIYAVSANNLGISGASPWSVQMIVSPTTSADVVLASAFQVGADGALVGAYGGLSNIPATGCFFGAGDYATGQVFTPSRIVPTPLAWYLLTVTYDGTSIRTYVDGALVSTRTATLNITNGKLILSGNVAHSGFYFTGAICRVGLWTRALALAEIAAAAVNPNIVPSSPQSFWRCNEGSGASLADSVAGNTLTITGSVTWANALARWPTWGPIDEDIYEGDSNTAGTATTPGGERKAGWPSMTKKRNSCGVRTAVSGGTPAYNFHNEGVSGDSLQALTDRMAGMWGNNTDFTLGSAGDPGIGNRGEFETLAARPAGEGRGAGRGACIVTMIGTNDLGSGALDLTAFEIYLKRRYNVYVGSGGTVRRWIVNTIIPRTDSAPAQTRTDTANAGLTAVVANLVAYGIPAVLVDVASSIVTGTMLEDTLHLNTLGQTTKAGINRPYIEA